jgi:hypothetical protein
MCHAQRCAWQVNLSTIEIRPIRHTRHIAILSDSLTLTGPRYCKGSYVVVVAKRTVSSCTNVAELAWVPGACILPTHSLGFQVRTSSSKRRSPYCAAACSSHVRYCTTTSGDMPHSATSPPTTLPTHHPHSAPLPPKFEEARLPRRTNRASWLP